VSPVDGETDPRGKGRSTEYRSPATEKAVFLVEVKCNQAERHSEVPVSLRLSGQEEGGEPHRGSLAQVEGSGQRGFAGRRADEDLVVAGEQRPSVVFLVENGEVERRQRQGDGLGFSGSEA